MSIKFNQVSHSYEPKKKELISKDAIKNINLEIADSDEFVAIIGKTGAGKSTLIQHINGLILPTEGTINVGEYTLTKKASKNPKLKPIRKQIGFAFQFPEYQLFEETVLKDIMYGPKNFGVSEVDARDKAIELAKKLNITDILNESPFNISGGQMRKVAIAGVLSYDPSILLLDEPTRGLDPKGAKDIMNFFNDLNKENHKSIIMITHDMNLVYEYAKRVVVLKGGSIVYDGTKEELFAKPDLETTYGLEKPEILSIIDYINANTDLKIDYNNYKYSDLLTSLRKVGESHE